MVANLWVVYLLSHGEVLVMHSRDMGSEPLCPGQSTLPIVNYSVALVKPGLGNHFLYNYSVVNRSEWCIDIELNEISQTRYSALRVVYHELGINIGLRSDYNFLWSPQT